MDYSSFGSNPNNPDSTILQLSGVIIDQENDKPISYITVRIKGTNVGMVSSANGFFSLPIHRRDTVLFSCIGFETEEFYVDSKTPKYKYYITIRMLTRVYQLKGIVIHGLTREAFKREFFTIVLPKMPEINPGAIIRSSQITLPPPEPGIRFSPSALIGEIPFIQRALKRKRSKKFAKENAKDIPIMKDNASSKTNSKSENSSDSKTDSKSDSPTSNSDPSQTNGNSPSLKENPSSNNASLPAANGNSPSMKENPSSNNASSPAKNILSPPDNNNPSSNNPTGN